MKHISLFSGIGGFDLASEWMGWQSIASCEINPFCRKVLSYYWPNSYHHDDIKTLNYETIDTELSKRFGEWRNDDIIISGGFPCQPYSAAGKRLGKEDDRHLWPEMLRFIQQVQPRWVVGENVRGLVNWNGGMVFEEVQNDLESVGYKVLPFILPACSVGAQQIRDRVWFVSYSDKVSRIGMGISKNENNKQWETKVGSKSREFFQLDAGRASFNIRSARGQESISEPSLIGCIDGISPGLARTSFREFFNSSNGAYGNAIVPQVVYQIFKAIEAYEKLQ